MRCLDMALAVHGRCQKPAAGRFRPAPAQLPSLKELMVVADGKPEAAETGVLRDALRQARVAEAAHFEATLALRDAQTIRLQLLKDDLAPIVASLASPEGLVDLALVAGEPPRLWIDPISSVVMEPDPRTYRFVQDSQAGRELLLETADRAEMVERVKTHIAHRIVARERQLATAKPSEAGGRGYSASALLLAWVSGFSVGVLALFVAGVLLSDYFR
jgi:hypothetical protein